LHVKPRPCCPCSSTIPVAPLRSPLTTQPPFLLPHFFPPSRFGRLPSGTYVFSLFFFCGLPSLNRSCFLSTRTTQIEYLVGPGFPFTKPLFECFFFGLFFFRPFSHGVIAPLLFFSHAETWTIFFPSPVLVSSFSPRSRCTEKHFGSFFLFCLPFFLTSAIALLPVFGGCSANLFTFHLFFLWLFWLISRFCPVPFSSETRSPLSSAFG